MTQEKFSPKTHKFGMAYRTTDGTVAYLIDYSHSLGFLLKKVDDNKNFTIRRSRVLYRAPEFDLVSKK